jgi:TPR repeat protein
MERFDSRKTPAEAGAPFARSSGNDLGLRSSAPRLLTAVFACGLSILSAGEKAPPQPTAEFIGSDLRVSIPMKSNSTITSDAEFERALENTPSAIEAKTRMAAVLAKEQGTHAALKLRGQERIDALERAARRGEAAAAEMLADMLDTGDGLQEDPTRAVGYYRAAALGGRMESAHSLGVCYSKGRGVTRDFAEALAWLVVAQRRGDTSHVAEDLRAYLERHGRADTITASEHRADELQHPATLETILSALPAVGPLEFDSKSSDARETVDNRPRASRESGAADDNSASAPIVVTTILGRRLAWPSLSDLQGAANRGDAAALTALGRLLANGKIVPADPMRAVVLLERAAKMGEADAAHQLGDLYSQGDGLVRDDAKSFSYFLQAAKGGSILAMANVGVYYTNGRGTERDPVRGLAWLSLAKSFGVDRGQEARLRTFLSQYHLDQVAAADELTKKLRQELNVSVR